MQSKFMKLTQIHNLYNFSDIFTKSKRKIQFRKGLEYAKFSIKKIEYEDFIANQSYDLS